MYLRTALICLVTFAIALTISLGYCFISRRQFRSNYLVADMLLCWFIPASGFTWLFSQLQKTRFEPPMFCHPVAMLATIAGVAIFWWIGGFAVNQVVFLCEPGEKFSVLQLKKCVRRLAELSVVTQPDLAKVVFDTRLTKRIFIVTRAAHQRWSVDQTTLGEAYQTMLETSYLYRFYLTTEADAAEAQKQVQPQFEVIWILIGNAFRKRLREVLEAFTIIPPVLSKIQE